MVDITLAMKFKEFIRNLPDEAFGNSSSWEVRGFVDNEQVTGSDKDRNALIRERRKETANDLFSKFLKEELSDAEKENLSMNLTENTTISIFLITRNFLCFHKFIRISKANHWNLPKFKKQV